MVAGATNFPPSARDKDSMFRRQLAILLFLLATTPLALWAGSGERYAAQVETFRGQIQAHSEAKQAQSVQAELLELGAWVDQASALLKRGEVEAAGYRLKRVELGLDLVRAMLALAQTQAALGDQRQGTSELEARGLELSEEIKALGARKRKLQQELSRLKAPRTTP